MKSSQRALQSFWLGRKALNDAFLMSPSVVLSLREVFDNLARFGENIRFTYPLSHKICNMLLKVFLLFSHMH